MERYCHVWEFRVHPDRVDDFVRSYRGDGAWTRLFRLAPGYLGTRLLRDRDDPLRFVTIDEWRSVEDYAAFRERFAAEYAALDRRCAGLTLAEASLGAFDG